MKQDFFDKPENHKLIVRSLVAVSFVLFMLDAILHRHSSHPWESMFGFYAIYGFVACVILVLIAKELRKLIMRDEDYYERSNNNVKDNGGDHD